MKIIIQKSVTVVTPTIGSAKLKDAIESVSKQTYGNINHLLVVDGEKYIKDVLEIISSFEYNPNIKTLVLPYNIGGNGYYGHRVYAAIGHLVNSDYVAFLDEDNWYEPSHIESLVNCIEDGRNDFVYSYRNIWNVDKSETVQDNCESLGQWPVWVSNQNDFADGQYLVDTSSYLFATDFLKRHGHVWHHGWGADRVFFDYAIRHLKATNKSTHKHTLNYRLDGNQNSVKMDFFRDGNDFMKSYYGEYPWMK